jgi:hypothetical protein
MFEKEKITIAYSVEKCKLCNNELKRKFQDGDFLFTETSKCALCDGKMAIEKIFGETIDK